MTARSQFVIPTVKEVPVALFHIGKIRISSIIGNQQAPLFTGTVESSGHIFAEWQFPPAHIGLDLRNQGIIRKTQHRKGHTIPQKAAVVIVKTGLLSPGHIHLYPTAQALTMILLLHRCVAGSENFENTTAGKQQRKRQAQRKNPNPFHSLPP